MEECTAVSRVVVGVVVSVVDGHVVKEVGIRKGKADMNAERSMMGLRAQSRREGGRVTRVQCLSLFSATLSNPTTLSSGSATLSPYSRGGGKFCRY